MRGMSVSSAASTWLSGLVIVRGLWAGRMGSTRPKGWDAGKRSSPTGGGSSSNVHRVVALDRDFPGGFAEGLYGQFFCISGYVVGNEVGIKSS